MEATSGGARRGPICVCGRRGPGGGSRAAGAARIEAHGCFVAIIAYSNGDRINASIPVDDDAASDEVLRHLFPRTAFTLSGTVSLLDIGIPQRGVLAAAGFEQGVLVSTLDAHLYNPSKLHDRYLKPRFSTVQLFTQRSFNDMFAYGHGHTRG